MLIEEMWLSKLRSSAALACALILTGCSSLPVSGPRSDDIIAGASANAPFFLAPLTLQTIEILSRNEPGALAGEFRDSRPPAVIKFGVGDVLSITVFEATAGGLFIPSEAGVRPGNFVQLPDQVIDNDGNISFPYAGVIRAAGLTNVQVQNEIIRKIKDRAIEPQVVVTLNSQRTNLISVMGEVNSPVRYAAAMSGAGDRVTDSLTRAGGIKGQGFESWVVLERNGRRATVPFENLLMNATNNVYVQPNDRIYVYREQQKFLAFGAAGQQGEFNFDAWRINLAEAVAKAGGLLDTQADPGSVFLYRREPKTVAVLLGADPKRFLDTVPVIYRVSFADPGGYFLATKLMMRNQDVIFAANAREVEISKFLNLVNLGSSTVLNGADGVIAARAIR